MNFSLLMMMIIKSQSKKSLLIILVTLVWGNINTISNCFSTIPIWDDSWVGWGDMKIHCSFYGNSNKYFKSFLMDNFKKGKVCFQIGTKQVWSQKQFLLKSNDLPGCTCPCPLFGNDLIPSNNFICLILGSLKGFLELTWHPSRVPKIDSYVAELHR